MKYRFLIAFRKWKLDTFERYIVEKYHTPVWCPVRREYTLLPIGVAANSDIFHVGTFIECYLFLLFTKVFHRKAKFRVVHYPTHYPGGNYYLFDKGEKLK